MHTGVEIREFFMIQCQLKLKLTHKQERKLREWLPILGSVWNFAVRKIELNAKDKIYFSRFDMKGLLSGHSNVLGVPSHVLQGVLGGAWTAWDRCFNKIARKPRLKGMRRPLNSIPFPDPIKAPVGNRIKVLGLGSIRFHKQELPEGRIKCARVCKRASGWYLCLFIDAQPNAIERTGHRVVGIDPGFSSLLTLSTGEKIGNPREFRQTEKRLGQAQRGNRKMLAARIRERERNKRKDRNHKLSRRLVAENKMICFLKDNHAAISKKFGKSVHDAGHGQLRQMLAYKCLIGGTELIFPDNRNSTRICSTCGAVTGPKGLAGLKVRIWRCSSCGDEHDRDQNAAQNAVRFVAGAVIEVIYVS